MSRKASIIVCTYNAKDDLKECLESLEKQDYDDKEIVVINDASTDGTGEFLQRFKSRSKTKIIVRTNRTNLGVAGSRNEGIRQATGEIMAFTDADCVADRRWLSELMGVYEDKGVAAVGGSIVDKGVANLWELATRGHDFVASEEGYVSYIQGCNMSFDSGVLRQFMFDDEIKYGYEEALLCDHLMAKGYKVYYRPQAMVVHKHRSSLASLMKRKYLLGLSSIWYRKKRKKLVMFKRHIILLMALLLVPFAGLNKALLFLLILLLLVFASSLLRDEILFHRKTAGEILLTFPVLLMIEVSHFIGSLVGILRFRLWTGRGIL